LEIQRPHIQAPTILWALQRCVPGDISGLGYGDQRVFEAEIQIATTKPDTRHPTQPPNTRRLNPTTQRNTVGAPTEREQPPNPNPTTLTNTKTFTPNSPPLTQPCQQPPKQPSIMQLVSNCNGTCCGDNCKCKKCNE
jgi:hypothetical protein